MCYTGKYQTPFSDSDHSIIYDKLELHAARWRDIGKEFHFLEEEMDNIQSNTLLLNTAPQSWLREMVTQWLQSAPGDARGSPMIATKEWLCYALLAVNLVKLAEEIQEILDVRVF